MYAIVTVMYGIPLNSNGDDVEWSDELTEAIEDETYEGFHLPYSGAGDVTPAAFGVELDEFDEACHHVELSTLKLIPTHAIQDKFDALWAKLSQTLQLEIAQSYGHPRVFFLWSIS